MNRTRTNSRDPGRIDLAIGCGSAHAVHGAGGLASSDRRETLRERRLLSRLCRQAIGVHRTGWCIPGTAAVPFAAVASYTFGRDGSLSGTSDELALAAQRRTSTSRESGTVERNCTGTLTVVLQSRKPGCDGNLRCGVRQTTGREARRIVCRWCSRMHPRTIGTDH